MNDFPKMKKGAVGLSTVPGPLGSVGGGGAGRKLPKYQSHGQMAAQVRLPQQRRPQKQQQQQEPDAAVSSEEDVAETEHHVVVNMEATYSPRQKSKYNHSPFGPHSLARRSNLLMYICFGWLCLLTILFLVHWILLSAPTSANVSVAPPILEVKRDQSKWHLPFNLTPDEHSNGRIVTLPVPRLNFDKLLRYDVCCRSGQYFVCRAISKNLGMDAYVTKDKKAVMQVPHPDMIGAQCVFMWVETREPGI